MPRTAYVNGRYVPHGEAAVHVEDRGYQFADGVYEVCAVKGGRFLDEAGHMARLERSLKELGIAAPMSARALRIVMRETARRNRVRDGLVYIQVTRGVAHRDHAFPGPEVPPSLVILAWNGNPRSGADKAAKGISVITRPDIRWGRCDIKSVSLLPNVLAMEEARRAGAGEAWLTDAQGRVTEGSRSNAWIVTKDGELVTRPADNAILNGITRRTLMRVAAENGMKIVERSFTVEEAKEAREAFITGAGAVVMPVVAIDGQPVGNGEPGSIALALREIYENTAFDEAM